MLVKLFNVLRTKNNLSVRHILAYKNVVHILHKTERTFIRQTNRRVLYPQFNVRNILNANTHSGRSEEIILKLAIHVPGTSLLLLHLLFLLLLIFLLLLFLLYLPLLLILLLNFLLLLLLFLLLLLLFLLLIFLIILLLLYLPLLFLILLLIFLLLLLLLLFLLLIFLLILLLLILLLLLYLPLLLILLVLLLLERYILLRTLAAFSIPDGLWDLAAGCQFLFQLYLNPLQPRLRFSRGLAVFLVPYVEPLTSMVHLPRRTVQV